MKFTDVTFIFLVDCKRCTLIGHLYGIRCLMSLPVSFSTVEAMSIMSFLFSYTSFHRKRLPLLDNLLLCDLISCLPLLYIYYVTLFSFSKIYFAHLFLLNKSVSLPLLDEKINLFQHNLQYMYYVVFKNIRI